MNCPIAITSVKQDAKKRIENVIKRFETNKSWYRKVFSVLVVALRKIFPVKGIYEMSWNAQMRWPTENFTSTGYCNLNWHYVKEMISEILLWKQLFNCQQMQKKWNYCTPAGGRGASVSAYAGLTNQLLSFLVDPRIAWIKHWHSNCRRPVDLEHNALYCKLVQKSPIWGAWLASSYLWAFRISLSLIKFNL